MSKSQSHSKKPKTEKEDLEAEVEELREKARNLALLPKNYRDLQPGSEAWEQYRKYIPESREAMDRWLHGAIMVYGRDLSPTEERQLRQSHKELKKCIVDPALVDDEAFDTTIKTAKADNISFIYMKGWPPAMIMAVNFMASNFNWGFRAKKELTDDKGRPLI